MPKRELRLGSFWRRYTTTSGFIPLWAICRQPSLKDRYRRLRKTGSRKKRGPSECVFEAWRNLSSDVIKPGSGHRLSDPEPDSAERSYPRPRSPFTIDPGHRARPSYRDASRGARPAIVLMSSGRLFLHGLLASRARLIFTGHVQNKSIASRRKTFYHRTVVSVLTERLSSGAHPM